MRTLLSLIFWAIVLLVMLVPWNVVFVVFMVLTIGYPVVLFGGAIIAGMLTNRADRRRAEEEAQRLLRVQPRLKALDKLAKPAIDSHRRAIRSLIESGSIVVRDSQSVRCSNAHVYKYSDLEPFFYDDQDDEPTELLCPLCKTSLFTYENQRLNGYIICKNEHTLIGREVGAVMYAPEHASCPLCKELEISITCNHCGHGNRVEECDARVLVSEDYSVLCEKCGAELL